jgi:tripartite-type tricarboxylate transporter receptor subunit TctC
MMDRRGLIASGVAALASVAAAPALAQRAWPRRPLTIMVPFDAGGSVDRLARGLAQYMPKYLGQPMSVEDRAGAGGMIGTNWLLRQPPDGYSVMLTPATPFIPVNILVTNARYTLDDFTFVNAQWTDYTVLLVPKNRPWQTARALIDAIRANPGKISTGVDFGSVGHITTIALLQALGLKPDAVRMVTFDGAGAMRTALAGGQVDFNIGQAEGAEVVRNFVRPLAVFLDHKVPGDDAPPINEVLKAYHASVPIIDGSVRTFVFPAAFKAKHPQDYARFVMAYRATLNDPAFRQWLATNQMAGNWVGEERTNQIIRANFEALKRYKDLIKA